jgi:molybdate transport system substrate-binding protein
MTLRLSVFARTALLFACAIAIAAPASAQLKVIISGGFSAAYRDLLPEFERTSGVTVTTTSGGSVGNGPNTVGNQLRRGVMADVIILAREGLRDLIAEGRTIPGTDVDLARSLIGVAVRAGAAKPDITTVDALKQTLLRAKSVAMSTSTSGVYLTTQLFPRLGIADEMARKSVMSGAAVVAKGEAELGLQQVSEILAVPGLELVGKIPSEIQYVTVYAAAVVAGSAHADAAKRLIHSCRRTAPPQRSRAAASIPRGERGPRAPQSRLTPAGGG